MAILRGGRRIGNMDIRIGLPRDKSLVNVLGDKRLKRTPGGNPESTISRFTAQINKGEGLARTNRFLVRFDLPNRSKMGFATSDMTNTSMGANAELETTEMARNVGVMCNKVTLPSRDVNTEMHQVYGPGRQMPYAYSFPGDITCTFYGDKFLRQRLFFENWQKKIFAPSSLLFYVGFDKKLSNVLHHMLFFDTDFDAHASDIYDDPKWPKAPLFYASFTSLTDPSVAPKDKESGFFLIPLAPDLEDSNILREQYFNLILERLEKHTNQSIKPFISFKESYCINDFKQDYNSYKGNAYGMANTLLQTAFLRPKIKSKKVDNLFFTGQLTVPGPGVPPSLISGKIASELIFKNTPQKVLA